LTERDPGGLGLANTARASPSTSLIVISLSCGKAAKAALAEVDIPSGGETMRSNLDRR
jgi:hypothetical protein